MATKLAPSGVPIATTTTRNAPSGVPIAGNVALRDAPTGVAVTPLLPSIVTPLPADSFFDDNDVLILATLPAGVAAPTLVQFFDGVTLLGSVVAAPYAFVWSNPSAGAHTITVRFHFPLGTSDATVNITSVAHTTFLPSSLSKVKIWLDPTDNASITIAGGLISSWTNKGDPAVNVAYVQATPAAQPELSRLRGRQSVGFFRGPAANPRLSGALLATINQPYEMLMALRPINRGNPKVAHIGLAGGRIQFQSTTYPRTAFGGAGGSLTTPYPASVACYPRFVANGVTQGRLFMNGALVAGPANGGTITLQTPMTLGDVNASGSGQKGPYGDVIVTNALLSAGEETQLNDYFAERWHTNETALKVMEVGDSITDGQGSTDGDGYRRILWNDWHSRGKLCNKWVEEQGHNEDVGWAGDLHFAFPGRGINFMLTTLLPLLGTPNGVQQFLPDLIMMLIGTNNARSAVGETYVPGTGPGSTYQAYIDLATGIVAKCPAINFVFITIPPQNDAVANPIVNTMNAQFQAPGGSWDTITALTGRPIVRVDYNTPMSLPGLPGTYNPAFSSDGIHPNDLGYAILKNLLVTALAQAAALP